MKILHINYSDSIGGASRAVYRIHKSLIEKNINSNLLVAKKTKKKDLKVFEINNVKLIFYFRIFLNKVSNFFFNNKTSILSLNLFSNKIYKEINKSDYDIVHLHWINNETISIGDIHKLNKKIIWTCHDMWPFRGIYHYSFESNFITRNFLDSFVLNYKKKLIKKKIYFVGVSKWVKNSIKNSIFKKSNISYINNPIDTNFWSPLKNSNVRKKIKLNSKMFYIGVGNLEINKYNRKGLELFLKAIKILEKKYDFEIVEFGNKEKLLINNSKTKIHSFGFLNNDQNLKNLYNAINILVVPSKLEAFGQVASEAILCGTPVVCFSKTGLEDIIVNKKNGYLAKKFSSQELAKGMEFFLVKRNLNKDKVRYTIKNKFSYKKISAEYIKIYNKILNEKN